MPSAVTPERFASGMTYDEYVKFVGSPENLKREPTGGSGMRRDYSAYFREAYDRCRLNDAQTDALKWLASQPGGPAKMLVLSEDWSSDCRRDVPTFARIAEAGGMELRIFNRDGQKFSASNHPTLDEAPDSNADIMAEFLLRKNGNTWQSIPVAVFYTKDLEYLYHYQEYPRIYDKDRLVVDHIRGPRPGETREQTRERSDREFGELFNGPFFAIWTSAAVDEIISALHRKVVLGAV
jgi:thiol-disulfide isomerase/thioredoxin